jgi:hypothetical protein
MFVRAIVLALVLPAAFAYWITARPAPAPPDNKSTSIRGSSGQPQANVSDRRQPSAVAAPASRTESFGFSPANPFGPAVGSLTPARATSQAPSQVQRKSAPPAPAAAESDTTNGN